jgi:crotonobetainyl-CoA:carnitine CoA-transferase CaiB-like acyl-CoA transferase
VPEALLGDLTVAVLGPARPLRFAARCLADLGARTPAAPAALAACDELDDLWLGVPEPLPAGTRNVDVALAERGTDLGGLEARAVVRYAPAGATAPRAGEELDERGVTAAGGVAIAVGEPGRPPLPLPEGAVDALAGTHLAAAAIAALLDGTGETEVAGVDALAALVAVNQQIYLPYGLPWMRAGRRASGNGSCYPYSLFPARDGLFCMIGRTDRDWRALLGAMGDPEWGREERFRDPRVVGRLHSDAADEKVAPWVASLTREELMERLSAVDFASAPVLRPDEVLELPALRGRWRRERHGEAEVRAPGRVFDVVPAPLGVGENAASAARAAEPPLVLDLSWVWSGPAVSVGLADLGATVVKVESSSRPDNTRLRGAPVGFEPAPGAPPMELSRYFHALNRGKRSVELDLKSEDGRARLRELAARADVIVENLSPGVMDRWGVSPSQVHSFNPGCVFVSMRGYRAHPTTAGLRAYAPALSSAAGLEHLVAYPGEAPLGAMNIAYSDGLASVQGLMLVLAGLWRRRVGGAGAAIELSQHEAAILANGRGVVASQLGRLGDGLEPFAAGADVVGAEQLPGSPWVSADLFGTVRSRWLGEVSVARLPWRRDGALPDLGAAGPELGADSSAFLARS